MVIKRPLRPVRSEHITLTPEGEKATLPTTRIEYEVTERGKGEYLPSKGKFKEGADDRRHTFTELECRLGGHVSAFTLLTRYAEAYASTEEEWEALAAERMNTILRLRHQAHGLYIST